MWRHVSRSRKTRSLSRQADQPSGKTKDWPGEGGGLLPALKATPWNAWSDQDGLCHSLLLTE